MSTSIKAVIFDLDDTLYPENDFVISGFSAVSKFISIDYKKSAAEIYELMLMLYKNDKHKVFNRTLENLDIIYSQSYIEKLIDGYHFHKPTINLFTDSKVLLPELKKVDLKLGIITDGLVKMQENKIESLGLKEYFNALVISDELGIQYRKPHKAPYIKCLENLELSPEESVYIGDNPQKDFITAKKLGIRTFKIVRDNGIYKDVVVDASFEADHKLSDIRDVLNFINPTK